MGGNQSPNALPRDGQFIEGSYALIKPEERAIRVVCRCAMDAGEVGLRVEVKQKGGIAVVGDGGGKI